MGKRKAKAPDWCVMAGEGARCLRCGGYERLPEPMPVAAFAPWVAYFGARHADCKDTGRVDLPAASVAEWAAGWDTGISSLAIYRQMLGLPADAQWTADYPHDPQDFGRCYRLLQIASEWRARIGEMATRGETWKTLATHWDELTALYEEELPTGGCPKLYDRMKALGA